MIPIEHNKFLRLADVERVVGLKRTKIAELIAAGEFPKPIPLSDKGRAVGWLERELMEWQAKRIAARDAKVA
jgi:prophage regulatory protein